MAFTCTPVLKQEKSHERQMDESVYLNTVFSTIFPASFEYDVHTVSILSLSLHHHYPFFHLI